MGHLPDGSDTEIAVSWNDWMQTLSTLPRKASHILVQQHSCSLTAATVSSLAETFPPVKVCLTKAFASLLEKVTSYENRKDFFFFKYTSWGLNFCDV